MPKSDKEKAEIRRETDVRSRPGKDRLAHEASRGVKIGKSKTLKHLNREPLSVEEFEASLASTLTESDRGVAIVGAAIIEEALTDAITAWLENAEDRDSLFHDVGSPFGTFRNKTVSAYALGICSKEIREQIDIVRTIRNLFSHTLRSIDFKNHDVTALCHRLPQSKTIPKVYAKRVRQFGEARIRFISACIRISFDFAKATQAKLRDEKARLIDRPAALESEAAKLKGEG